MVRSPAWYYLDMPTYAFRCGDCGQQFEVTAHISERDDKAVCPRCGSRDVKTVFGSFAVGGAHVGGDPGGLLQRGFAGAAADARKP